MFEIQSLGSHPQTIQVWGTIYGRCTLILIDPGATNNFVDPSVVREWEMQSTVDQKHHVLVGGGEYLHTQGCFPTCSVQLGQYDTLVDLQVLPLECKRVILGVQWLRALGLVTTDYANLLMKFLHEGRKEELRGVRMGPTKEKAYNHLQQELDGLYQGMWLYLATVKIDVTQDVVSESI